MTRLADRIWPPCTHFEKQKLKFHTFDGRPQLMSRLRDQLFFLSIRLVALVASGAGVAASSAAESLLPASPPVSLQ